MDIEKILFNFTETKTYTLTVSKENGWDMPETANELVSLVNEIKSQPSKFLCESEEDIQYDTEFVSSNIIEAKTAGN